MKGTTGLISLIIFLNCCKIIPPISNENQDKTIRIKNYNNNQVNYDYYYNISKSTSNNTKFTLYKYNKKCKYIYYIVELSLNENYDSLIANYHIKYLTGDSNHLLIDGGYVFDPCRYAFCVKDCGYIYSYYFDSPFSLYDSESKRISAFISHFKVESAKFKHRKLNYFLFVKNSFF